MIASQLIQKEINPANSMTAISYAIDEMEKHQIYHLPYIEEKKLIGIISDEDIREENIGERALASFVEEVKPVLEDEYFFEIWSHMASNNLTCVPVVDKDNNYLGTITQQNLVKFYTLSFAYTEPGSIIILSMKRQDYSLSKIASIIEEENAIILSSFVTEKKENDELLITIKLNKIEIDTILKSFYRYEMSVSAVFSEREYADIIHDRYEGLMQYLNI